MSARTSPLLHREAFERNVLVALGLGAAAGVAQLGAATLLAGLGVPLPVFPDGTVGALFGLPVAALLAAVQACVAGDRMDRLLLRLGAVLLVPLPFAASASPMWKLALSGALAGPLMVQGQLCDRGERGQIGAERPGRGSFLLAALATALLAPIGVLVARVLAWRLGELGAPMLLVAAFSGAVVALFVALGSIPAHLGLAPDPEGNRLVHLLPRASGELRRLLARALELYRRCSQGLAALPREPDREALAQTVSAIAGEIADLGEQWVKLAPLWDAVGGADTEHEIARLEHALTQATDEVARAQLALALQSHRRERSQSAELRRRQERMLARLEAEVALLGAANLALVQARTGDAQNGRTELGALAQNLNAMLSAEQDAALLADARAEVGAPTGVSSP